MRHLNRAHLQFGIPQNDLLTWVYLLSGGNEGFIEVSGYEHIYDRIYGSNDVVKYLNRLHIGLFAMRSSWARHLGHSGSPLELVNPQTSILYFAKYLASQYPRLRNDPGSISWVAQSCLVPMGLDIVKFAEKRAKVCRMNLI